jgi:hypothetical protein
MKVFKYINISVFFVSLAFGIFAVYITTNDRVIYVYPTPENIDQLLYRDKTDACFKFEKKETKCPEKSSIFSIYPQA